MFDRRNVSFLQARCETWDDVHETSVQSLGAPSHQASRTHRLARFYFVIALVLSIVSSANANTPTATGTFRWDAGQGERDYYYATFTDTIANVIATAETNFLNQELTMFGSTPCSPFSNRNNGNNANLPVPPMWPLIDSDFSWTDVPSATDDYGLIPIPPEVDVLLVYKHALNGQIHYCKGYNLTDSIGNLSSNEGQLTFISLSNNEFDAPSTTVPGSPTSVSATPSDTEVTVSWTAPSNDGGSTITGYTVTGDPSGTCEVDGTTTQCTITGLTNGTPYTFTVKATNAEGDSEDSQASQSVTPVAPATVPGPPTSVSATPSNTEATVSWTAPGDDGGSTITGYTVTATPGGATCTTNGETTCTITGLTNGTPYTFTVKATNAEGDSEDSQASQSVTPVAPATVSGITLRDASGNSLPTALMSNLPFSVRVALVDDNGDPFENENENGTVTLTATGGSDASAALRFAFGNASTPVSATIPVGESSVLIENVVFTGASAGSITLNAVVEGGSGDGLTQQVTGLTFTPVTLSLTSPSSDLPADGVSTTLLTIELTEADGAGQEGQTIRLTTDLGTLFAGESVSGGGSQTLTITTDANGMAKATLRAPDTTGVATITAACPGDCPTTFNVTFIGAITNIASVAGNERAWIVFDKIAGVSEVDIETWPTSDPEQVTTLQALATEPVALTGLQNDTETTLRIRASFDESRKGPWSDPVTVTPTATAEERSSEPSIESTSDDIQLQPDPNGDGTTGTFEITIRARNTSTEMLPHLWMQALDVPDHVELVSVIPSAGTIELVQIDGENNWFWRDANLEPVGADTPTQDIPYIVITLRVEVQ